jgi:hypothetical protein
VELPKCAKRSDFFRGALGHGGPGRELGQQAELRPVGSENLNLRGEAGVQWGQKEGVRP